MRRWAVPLVALAACSSPTQPAPPHADFVVAVADEWFVMRSTDPQTIELARQGLHGGGTRFPIGPVRPGSGGFNGPWTWHLDPAGVRMTEAAIEVCDGLPSYVEAHQQDFPTYCPWAGRVVAEL